MAEVEITYKGSSIVTMNASGTKTLGTAGKYCEDDIEVEYTRPTPTLQSKSATPTESAQTITPDSGYDGLSQVSVGAISSSYVGSNVPRQAAQTITPTTSDQTIASGKYLTGAQTIKGDQNLVAANIKKDVVLFGITGSYEGSGGGGVQDVTVSVIIEGRYSIDDWFLPSYATRNGNTVTVKQYGAFLIWLSDYIDGTSQTGTVERNVVNSDRVVVYAGESGGTITLM